MPEGSSNVNGVGWKELSENGFESSMTGGQNRSSIHAA